jgi:hypothetical protein
MPQDLNNTDKNFYIKNLKTVVASYTNCSYLTLVNSGLANFKRLDPATYKKSIKVDDGISN